MQPRLEVRGLDQVLAEIGKLQGAASDLTPVWPIIGRLWADRERQVFATNGLGKWPMLSAATILRKGSSTPLVDKGSLLGALGNADPRYASDSEAVFGPPKSAKAATREGGRHARGTVWMPARNPVPRLRAAERRAWVEAIRIHLSKGL